MSVRARNADVIQEVVDSDRGDRSVLDHTELSGRPFNQVEGEQAPLDVQAHVRAANPYNVRDAHFISKHARAILTTLLTANVPPNPEVLDMGSGWGLSSEMLAFCGANVTTVDINPLFVELVEQRAIRSLQGVWMVRDRGGNFPRPERTWHRRSSTFCPFQRQAAAVSARPIKRP